MKIIKKIFYFVIIIIVIKIWLNYDTKISRYSIKYKNNKIQNYNTLDLKKGYSIAKNSTLNICFIARDCKEQIKKNMYIINKIGSLFKDYKIIIFENDSIDGTRDFIKNLIKKNRKIYLIECDVPDCILNNKKGYDYGQFSRNRISKMGYYRNKYLEEALKTNYDFTMVLDIDLDYSNFNINNFIYTLSKYEIWDGVFMNTRINLPGTFGLISVSYDAQAFSKDNIGCNYFKSSFHYLKDIIYSYIILWRLGNQDFFPVDSAFNGLGIYKTRKLIHSSYSNNGKIPCEHCYLHNNLKNLYISKKWVNFQDIEPLGDGTISNQVKNILKR